MACMIGASAASPTLVVKTEICLYVYMFIGASVSEPHTSESNNKHSLAIDTSIYGLASAKIEELQIVYL